MSYSCYAYVIHGIKVPRSEVVLQEAKRGCEHHMLSGSFCSQCGAPRWASYAFYVDGCNSECDPYKWRDFDLIIRDDYALIGIEAAPFTSDGDISKIAIHYELNKYTLLYKALNFFQDSELGYWLISTGG